MDVNDDAYCLNQRVALESIASKRNATRLSPTGLIIIVNDHSSKKKRQPEGWRFHLQLMA